MRLEAIILFVMCTMSAQGQVVIHNAALENPLQLSYVDSISTDILPSGILLIDHEAFVLKGGLERLLYAFDPTGNITFSLEKTVQNSRREDIFTYRFRQMHHGIPVENAGFSITGGVSAAPIGGPPGPVDPCFRVLSINPQIYSGLEKVKIGSKVDIPFSTTSMKKKGYEKIKYIGQSIFLSKKKYDNPRHSLKFQVQDKGVNKHVWIDVKSGKELEKVALDPHIDAETGIYGVQDLDDITIGGETSLISGDGRVSTFNMNDIFIIPGIREPETGDYTIDRIPTTAQPAWPGIDFAEELLYASHFSTTQVVPFLDEIGVGAEFPTINVGAYPFFENARSLPNNPDGSANIAFGLPEGLNSATIDVSGHELGHSYARIFFDYNDNGMQTRIIHEAFCDMLGTYVEFRSQGDIADWVIGDDNFLLGVGVDRNLSAPLFDCWTESEVDGANQYEIGSPLSHWYFLISNGDAAAGIPAIGLRDAIDIAVSSVASLNGSADVENFVDQTIASASNLFGPCSDQYDAVIEAWNTVCFPRNSCDDYNIDGPSSICYDQTWFTFTVANPIPGATYRWNFPHEWNVYGNNDGDNSHYGTAMTVIDIPTYNSYPTDKTVHLYSLTAGGPTRSRRVRINSCGFDPCKEIGIGNDDFLLSRSTNSPRISNESVIKSYRNSIIPEKATTFLAYDLYGRVVKRGLIVQGDELSNLRAAVSRSVLIISFFDSHGAFIESKKIVY